MAKTKKEIDKEVMYHKIMPSALKPAKPAEGEGAPQAQAPRPAPAPAPVPVPAAAPQNTPAPQKSTLFANENGVQFKDKSPSVLVNIMENIVVDRLDAAFSKFNCCKCDKCKKDVAAIALNKLHPKYVVAEQEKILDLVEKQTSVEVTTAIVQAILKVRQNPRH